MRANLQLSTVCGPTTLETTQVQASRQRMDESQEE